MRIFVRRARSEDAAAVEAVLLASYPALMSTAYDAALLTRALPLMTRPQSSLLASGRYFLAEAGGEAVGCGGWSFTAPGTTHSEPGLAHIRHFATAKDWAGRGVGRAIYARCEIQARAAGAKSFECLSSLNGVLFYSALGFRALGVVNVTMGPGLIFPSMRMIRTFDV